MGDDEYLLEYYNLARVVTHMIETQVPEEKRGRYLAILEGSAGKPEDLELMRREGDEIWFRIDDIVFHVPLVALTQPMTPEDVQGN